MRKFTLSLVTFGLLLGGACTPVDPGSPAPERGTGGSKPPAGTGGSPATSTGGSPAPAGTGGAPGTGGAVTVGTGGTPATTGTGGTPSPDTGSAEVTPTPDPPTTPQPGAPCPRCVKIFNGMNFDGWEASPSTWKIVDGAMRGQGGTSRAAYTKKDYGNVRLILTSRMAPINGDHLGVLFWGDRPMDPNRPKIDLAGWLQWMPPNGSMWSYHAPMHHNVSAMRINAGPGMIDQWHTSEILLNLDKGTLRGATDGKEINRYTHPWPTERMDPTKKIIKGPLAMMRHGGGASEYKDIWVEEDPIEDKLITVK